MRIQLQMDEICEKFIFSIAQFAQYFFLNLINHKLLLTSRFLPVFIKQILN